MNKAIILAAGQGTRMKSKKPKVLHEVSGYPMIDYVYRALNDTDMDEIYIITGHEQEAVHSWCEENWETKNYRWIEQPMGEMQPYGTGFAVMQALPYIEDDDVVLVVCGDTPLLRGETLLELKEAHTKNDYKGTVLIAEVEDPSGYGRIVRDADGEFLGIREEKDCTDEEKTICEINGGVYCFEGRALKRSLDQITDDNAQGEYYLTDVLEILRRDGEKMGTYTVEDSHEIDGINSRVQLAACEQLMKARINRHWMSEGVTFIEPSQTIIERHVQLGKDVTLWPGVILQGDTVIGDNCEIMGTSRIVDSVIADDVMIESSVIECSKVAAHTKIGPFAHLRPGAELGEHVKIGNFVEVKKAKMGNHSKAAHLTYIGDATIGERVNIGCGVIFVNYDGKNKFRSIVEDDAFVGSNVNLVAPLHIGQKAVLAAGSTITKDVEPDTLAIERGTQGAVKEWSKRKAEKAKKSKGE